MNIIEVNKENIVKAGEILAVAFKDDPIFKYIFQTQEKYDRCAAWLFSTWVRWAVMFGKAWMTDDESAVIIMRAIGKSDMGLWSMIRAGMLPVPIKLGFSTFKRFYFEIVSTLDKEHARVMGKTPHWYGWMVGVKPEHKRVGWKLINHCIEIADRAQLPLFLETSTDRNVSLYNHRDFEVKDEKFIARGNFKLYFMVREPKQPSFQQALLRHSYAKAMLRQRLADPVAPLCASGKQPQSFQQALLRRSYAKAMLANAASLIPSAVVRIGRTADVIKVIKQPQSLNNLSHFTSH